MSCAGCELIYQVGYKACKNCPNRLSNKYYTDTKPVDKKKQTNLQYVMNEGSID